MKYRPDIDGLRTVAVLPVIVYHAGLGLSGGFIGVDVFFVISGFLITTLLISEIDQGNFSILKFYERRARRIFPALYAMVMATTLAASIIMLPFDFEDYGKSVVATTLFAANVWFFRQEGYFTEAAELEPLLHTWSLGVEEQYYIFFPVLLVSASRIFAPKAVFILIFLLGIASFLATVLMLATTPEAAFYLPHLRAWELLIGSLLAIAMWRGWWQPSWLPFWVTQIASVAGLALILWPVFTYSAETPFPGVAALPPCLGAMLLIAVGSDGRSIATRLLSRPPMVFTGKLSYSLYLWHWPVISLVYYKTGALSFFAGLACLVVSFGLAFLSWRFIEQPIRDRALVGKRTIAVGSVAGILLLTSTGALIWQLKGLPNRVEPELLAVANSANYLHDRRDCHFVTPERARDGDVCVRGAAGVQPSFVLVGDSHADAFSPAIFAAADELGLAGYQYTDGGFLPLPGVWRLGGASAEEFEAFVSFIEDRPTIETLIITRYWQHQMTGYTYRHKGSVWRDEAYDGSGTSYNAIATRNGLERLANHFRDRRIIILDDVPTGRDMHIRDQLRLMRNGETAELGLSTEDYRWQRSTYEATLLGIAADLPNVYYRPVFVDVCDEQICSLFDGETLLFRNGDHLSWEGALKLTNNARELLQSIPDTNFE